MRRSFTVASVVTFVLLVASALVSLSPSPSGLRTPAAGAAGVHRSGPAVSDVVSAPPVLCSASAGSSSVATPAPPLPESCHAPYTVGGMASLASGAVTNAPVPDPTLAAYPSTLTTIAKGGHSDPLGSTAGRSGTAARGLLGSSLITLSHHNAKPANVPTKNGPPTVHIVFTQAGAERWDAADSGELHRDVTFPVGDHVPSDPTLEPTNTSLTTFDGKVQILTGNLSAARAHQFASSL